MKIQDQVHARIPTSYGEFSLHYFTNNTDHKEHLALVMGDVAQIASVPVRIHSECLTGDIFGSLRCDCGEQLNKAMQLIAEAGFGVIIYLRQEGRGIGLMKKLQAYNLQDQGLDTVDANLFLGHRADEREYDVAALILMELQVKSIRLMTNNPEKISKLQQLGIVVEERIAIEMPANVDNQDYLQTKANKMSHWLAGNKFSFSAQKV